MSPRIRTLTSRFAIALSMLALSTGFPAWAERQVGSAPAQPAPPSRAVPPLTLEQALERAFENNPDVLAAGARIGVAEAKVREATAAFYPKLTARVGYDYTDNPANAFSYIVAQRRFSFDQDINHPGWVENFRPEIVGGWSLYRGGQDYYRKKAAELGVEAAALEREAVRNRLAAAVAGAYFALLAAPREVEVARRSRDAVQAELDYTEARYREGMALKAEVLSLEVRAAEAQEAELKALNAVELSRSGLKTLLGARSDETIAVRDVPDTRMPSSPQDFEQLLSEALRQRPELQAASRQVEMRRKELEAERGARWPRVNAYAAYGQNSRAPGFSFSRDNAALGVNAEVDLFSGGAVSARIEAAERRLAEAQALEERARLEIEDELRRSYTTLREALERVKVAQAAATSAEEALRLTREQYRGGTAPVTRYLETEADRAEAERRVIVARYDAQIAEAGLKKALGHWR